MCRNSKDNKKNQWKYTLSQKVFLANISIETFLKHFAIIVFAIFRRFHNFITTELIFLSKNAQDVFQEIETFLKEWNKWQSKDEHTRWVKNFSAKM